ncbi:UDP-GlcNAc--UDP-phosphate GlcNAc-1-phosphate transferase [Litoribacter alkaliphilus]|uniref:UDP-GlcNAc--UDP-phosphate GlcNAc-1-phosphate transferase n=1 Tax=Litoribacter ruber TaxID=702568 RepID=A0AAP2CFS8_9BACT|nr:UDP-GlcNAc--UDP-phosphate GlcNAc-1-phosphate transferase [Litoribacter alkaliphilus]MBS9523202.1 UDP-GlcNAc--UDP-phosphate GlcNAc-1-phosphate transferase [Litoribacter alkaliphilus]
MYYLFAICALLATEILYIQLAKSFRIVDLPTDRSSHKYATVRGGGVIFPIALFLPYYFGEINSSLVLVVLLVAAISFLDDMFSLSQLPRAVAQIAGTLYLFYDLEVLYLEWYYVLICAVLFFGWINAYNFMDGINGISVLYCLVALISFSVIEANYIYHETFAILGLACLVFSFFNLRQKAVAFLGDVGSISLAIILGYFMLHTIVATDNIYYLLFFAIYGVDAIITIFIRLLKRENILKPHRSHLYQQLANEHGKSHIRVSVCYALAQLSLNFLLIYGIGMANMSAILFTLVLCTIFFFYILARINYRIKTVS